MWALKGKVMQAINSGKSGDGSTHKYKEKVQKWKSAYEEATKGTSSRSAKEIKY